jgi:hypothetical protein
MESFDIRLPIYASLRDQTLKGGSALAAPGCTLSFRRRFLRVSRERPVRGRRSRLFLQSFRSGPRTHGRRLCIRRLSSSLGISCGLHPGGFRNRAFFRSSQLHSRPASFRQTDRDGLLGILRAVFARANMIHFLANKFACLC